MGFQCSQPGCKRSYIRKEHLQRHEKNHANLRPFTCDDCPTSFNRRDLLNRHVSMKHTAGSSGSSERRRGANTEALNNQPVVQLKPSMFPAEEGIWPPNPLTNPLLRDAIHRSMLKDAHFQFFHPHWPILHQCRYRTAPQAPDLVRCVLVTGFWMVSAHREAEARKQHDSLLKALEQELGLPSEISKKIPQELGVQNLALFQAILIPLILCTYRGPKTIPESIIHTKHLFLAFERVGIYDQATLDSADLDPTVEEQYQRLVLAHFKTNVHINTMLAEHYTKFKPMEYLQPKQLKIRAPLPLAAWDGGASSAIGSNRRLLISEQCQSGVSASCLYAHLGPLTAWDFTTGMILGCFITQQSSETYAEVLQRVKPFLFLHASHLSVDWGGGSTE